MLAKAMETKGVGIDGGRNGDVLLRMDLKCGCMDLEFFLVL
jgi:hypothetical protein